MHEIVAKPRLVGMAGSLRKGSYSRAALLGLRGRLPANARLDICDMQLPLYNEDDDGPAAQEAVHAFRHSIAASDGVVIVTPEYNHGIPGVLKNALDWASRPFGQSGLIDKPVLVMSISPAFTGGVRAQAQLHETLLAIQARIVPGPQIVIGGAADKVRDGVLVDSACLGFLLPALERLIVMSCDGRSQLTV
jgi:chromate reductase, NAD(P)H dehydrogenase (quinone)